MIRSKWIDKKINYDGSQLRSLYAYLSHGVQGHSVISFRGACNVSFDHMVDGEDLLAKAKIKGSDMVHFIFEIFDRDLYSGVLLQRLFASVVSDQITSLTKGKINLTRNGDDLYFVEKGKLKKLSISIATRSPVSIMVHFAVNVSTEGTPVPTVGLDQFKIPPKKFAQDCLLKIQNELNDIIFATMKVRPIS